MLMEILTCEAVHMKHGVKYGLEEGKSPCSDFAEEFDAVSKSGLALK